MGELDLAKNILKLEPEKIQQILDIIANSKFYTKPFADELGRSVAEFYKEMLQDQVPEKQATEFTRDYISFIRYPTDVEKFELTIELEYNRKVAKIYQEVNERLWNLLNKLTIVHTVDAKSVMMTKSTKLDNDDD
ncbi:MAG: hypothetical protein HWN67_17305 [Candidatus Helarchaeota archaeon]|nr:hypothetical protein [Candidatus Helarchaeota archaeon]